MSDSRRILLTEGSSTSARQTLHCLGGRHTIDIMDSAALSQGRFSTFVRHWHRCPLSSADPIAYLRRLKELIDEHHYDVVVATHEQAYLLSRVRDQLQNHVGVALPTFDAIDRLQDKANFARVMEELGLPQPHTRIVDGTSAQSLQEGCSAQSEFPCFLKTAHGTAGRGVVAIHDSAEMREWVKEQTASDASLPNQEIVLQSAAPSSIVDAWLLGTTPWDSVVEWAAHRSFVSAHTVKTLLMTFADSASHSTGTEPSSSNTSMTKQLGIINSSKPIRESAKRSTRCWPASICANFWSRFL